MVSLKSLDSIAVITMLMNLSCADMFSDIENNVFSFLMLQNFHFFSIYFLNNLAMVMQLNNYHQCVSAWSCYLLLCIWNNQCCSTLIYKYFYYKKKKFASKIVLIIIDDICDTNTNWFKFRLDYVIQPIRTWLFDTA
jgi:hypothetical protein